MVSMLHRCSRSSLVISAFLLIFLSSLVTVSSWQLFASSESSARIRGNLAAKKNKKKQGANMHNIPKNDKKSECIPEGGKGIFKFTAPGHAKQIGKCCKNLVVERPGDSTFICTRCGNGSCKADESNVTCGIDCHCGNFTVDRKEGETCDLGPQNGQGKGCTANCKQEPGWLCKGGAADQQCFHSCGNGTVDHIPYEPWEKCDDGNTQSGDGCSGQCDIEPGWNCNGASTNSQCHRIGCGNGFIDFNYDDLKKSEECDDGDTESNDGCSAQCKKEPGFACINQMGLSVCKQGCGDGLLIGDNGEICDDGNTQGGDGCDENCLVEANYGCERRTLQPNSRCARKK